MVKKVQVPTRRTFNFKVNTFRCYVFKELFFNKCISHESWLNIQLFTKVQNKTKSKPLNKIMLYIIISIN